MTTPLFTVSIRRPATLGLIAESPEQADDPGIATVLDNAAYDTQGRICARKGWTDLTTTGAHSDPVDAIFEYVKDATTSSIISAANAKLYEGTSTLTDITGALTPADDDWQFLNFNGKCIGVQAGESPIVYTGTGSFATIVPASGTLPTGNAGLSAWGRLWITDSDEVTIKWCGSLDETDWGGAGAGSLDTTEVWPDGLDRIVALAEWQDRLVIFGRRSVLIYSGPEDPTASTFVLDDAIRVGCVARDTVAAVANDLVFLDVDGLHSLRRAIEYENTPQEPLALSVRRDLAEDVEQVINTPETIRAAYSRLDNIYLLRIGSTYWSFDMTGGRARPSKWFGIGFKSLHPATNGALYFGQTGVIGQYSGFLDDASTYQFRYKSSFLDLSEGREAFPKTGRVTIVSPGAYIVTMSLAYDHIPDQFNSQFQMPAARNVAEWNVAEWGIGEWSGQSSRVVSGEFDLSGAGARVQIGISVNVNGSSFCIQRIDMTARLGRIAA